MNTITLGVRNAFRNTVRSASIIIILGLSIGLSLTMLIAHQAVGQKIAQAKSSIGNTISIAPAGFNDFSQANNALTTSQLGKVSSLAHVTNVTETLTDRLTTIGSTQPSFGKFGGNSSSSTSNQTSLKSPTTITMNGSGSGGRHFFINGGASGSLPTNFSLPISIVGTSDPTNLGTTTGDSVTIASGKAMSGASDTNNAMISQSMASKNNLKVGSSFTAYSKTLTVAGIFKSSTQASDDDVIVSLPTEQRLSGQSGDVTSAVATVDSVDNLSSATSAIKNTLGSNADVTNSQVQVNQTIQPLNSVRSIALYSLIGAVIAGSIIILLTMIMIVRERRREIGILKAIGASDARVIFQFMSEAVTLTLAGALIGVALGIIGSNPVTNVLVKNSATTTTSVTTAPGGPGGGFAGRSFGGGGQTFRARSTTGRGFFGRNTNSLTNSIRNVHANVGWSILAYGLGAALLIAIIGSSLAGWLIARVRPSEVLRAE